jgi:uronate dehydrogenase
MIFDKLLLTGAAGKLGSVLRPALRSQVGFLRSSDIKPLLGSEGATNEELVIADLSDPSTAARLVEGIDAVVHFGGIALEADYESISRVNINGTYYLYEAARQAGVKRVVFASSVHAVGFYEQLDVIDASVPQRPDTLYGLSKAFGEDLARLYWDKYGVETVCIRIGSSFPEPIDRRMMLTWLSFRDLVQLVARALRAPRVGHLTVYGISDNYGTFWDNRLAGILGYRPEDSSEVYRDKIEGAKPAPDKNDVVSRLQGGAYCL